MNLLVHLLHSTLAMWGHWEGKRDPLDPSPLPVRDKQSYPAALTLFYLRRTRNHQRVINLSSKRELRFLTFWQQFKRRMMGGVKYFGIYIYMTISRCLNDSRDYYVGYARAHRRRYVERNRFQ